MSHRPDGVPERGEPGFPLEATMAQEEKRPVGPDLGKGIPIGDVPRGGTLVGHANGETVVLVRVEDDVFAISPHCTHYHGPLAQGLVLGDTLRCPWHHACFDLRTGEATRAPALDPLACWRVEIRDGVAYAREKQPSPQPRPAPAAPAERRPPAAIVIVGGGAAGLAAADMLRREGYAGALTLLSADSSAPYDRPNLSKDFLAGSAPDEWIPLRSPDYYAERRIDLVLGARVASLDVPQRRVVREDGKAHAFDALLLATGADPVRLSIEGAAEGQIHYLRTFADSRALVARAASARRVVVVGASFIGLEV